MYLFNGRYEEISTNVVRIFEENKWPFLIIDLLTEFEAADFKREERLLLNLPAESELDLLIKGSYKLLDLITFFTMVKSGEIRAWTLKKGQTAIEAGGIVHSDFQEHFIKADVINWKNLVYAGGFHPAREKGLIRTEGKEYIVQDGDVIEIKSNV